jgi:hypothetical protein
MKLAWLRDRRQDGRQTIWRCGLLWLGLLCVMPSVSRAASQGSWEAVHTRLEVLYDAAERTIQGHASFAAVWRGRQPLRMVYFFLPPNTLRRRDPREPAAITDLRYARGFEAASLTVRRVTDGAQRDLSFRLQDAQSVPVGHVPDAAVLRVVLPRPYQAGERVKVDIAFTTHFPRAKNWGVYRGTVALDGLWYPMLVPYRHGTWIWGMEEFVHTHYTLVLTTDADQHVVASVPWTERVQRDGRQILSGSAGPLYHLGLSSSTDWYSERDSTSQPRLRVLVPPGDKSEAGHLLRTLRSVVEFYHQQFGLVLPTPVFTVVVHERDTSWPYSAAADNMLFLSRDLVRVPSLLRKLPEYFTARGVAQQWWGLRTAYNLNTERWIGEGLATYLALRWLDHRYGRGRNFLTWKGAWLPNFSYREQAVEVPYRGLAVNDLDQVMITPLRETSNREGLRLTYEKKGALVYSMLHDLLGAETFRAFLHLLAAEGRGTIVTTQDVRYAAEAVSGRDLTWFFKQWVRERAQLDYAVGRVEITPRTDPQGRTVYVNRVEIRRLGDAVMPLTVRLLATDDAVYETRVAGRDPSTTVTWQHAAPLSDVQLDPGQRLPDVQRLNNTEHVTYAVRPLIDFPRLDRYLLYPFLTLENNFIDGNMPRLHLFALYLDDQLASVSVGYKETPDEISVEGQFWRNRFPHPKMATGLTFTDRLSARTLTLETSLTLKESHQQHSISANVFTLGYRVSFLERLEEFNGEPVPDDFAPSTGRLHSVVFQYRRDTRVPTAIGAPPEVIPEPLTYGYVLNLEVELASELLGSTEPDFQQVRWEAEEFLRLWNQSWLQLRVFGGWSAGTIPLQRKLTLAGIDTVRGYPYRLRFLGDRMLGGTLAVRFPVLRDVRLEFLGRYFALRSLHISPFIDAGWVWDTDQSLSDVSLRSGVGLRIIMGFTFVSLLHFEVAVDLAHAVDERGLEEDEGVQFWIRFQSTTKSAFR